MRPNRQQRREAERKLAKHGAEFAAANETTTALELVDYIAARLDEDQTVERVVLDHTADPLPAWFTDAMQRARNNAQPGRPPALLVAIDTAAGDDFELFTVLDTRAAIVDGARSE